MRLFVVVVVAVVVVVVIVVCCCLPTVPEALSSPTPGTT